MNFKTADFVDRRWFMGKNRTLKNVDVFDEIFLENVALKILKVDFENGESDFYTYIQNEENIASFLKENFFNRKQIKGKNGIFEFNLVEKSLKNQQDFFEKIKPLNVEQSNSSFINKGKCFFKLFRRLEIGENPEQEILLKLSQEHFINAPQLLGYIFYKSESKNFTLGVLENHIENAKNLWDVFTEITKDNSIEKFKSLAFELGKVTAQMHLALKNLPGELLKKEEPPFEKLINLIKNSALKNKNALIDRVKFLQMQNEKFNQNMGKLKPQRIHGDFHLGQVLLQNNTLKILDFEGEPTRSINFRKTMRNPAVDIAYMLRSFSYSAAVLKSKNLGENFDNFEKLMGENFIKGYSLISLVPIDLIKKEAEPFVIQKAIYEACYELEFRPTWFWIPEKALCSNF